MKAILYNKRAKPHRLVYTEVERPVPGDEQVLVKVVASSVNAADYRSMKMGIIPRGKIFGADIAGRIELVGKNVTQFKPGDEVMGDLADSGFGGFAEYALAPADLLVLKPAKTGFDIAASIPLAGVTALQALRKANIRKGQEVLIVGSSGGVGTFALQLAKYFGTEVTAVCSTRNVEQSRSLGADHVIDYTKDDFTRSGRQWDLIIAVNGNTRLLTYRPLLKPGGRYLMVGGSLSQIFSSIFFGRLMSLGSKKMGAFSAKPNREELAFLTSLVEKGTIKPVIESYYTLENTPEAMQYASSGHARGKVIINVE